MVNDPYENSAIQTGLVNRQVADRYEILEVLGEGPLLTAYRARDKQANRIVTVKAVRPEFARDRDVLQRLRDGIGKAYSLAHSNIARVYDVGTDQETGLLYVAEEYVRGIDLRERIRRVAPFQLAAATDTAIAITEALEAAHQRGIAHGDVRPQNILIGPEGQIKLTNFGVADAQTSVALNDPTLLKRIVGYTAPDAARAAEPTASADLYAVGCILFEMLTGMAPYSGDSPVQVALKHVQEPIPSPRQINAGIPPALDGIVRKALEKTPERRYVSATELLGDLKQVRDGLRFSKPLNWTPKERENSADRSVSQPVAPAAVENQLPRDTVPPSVMPTLPATPKPVSPPVKPVQPTMDSTRIPAVPVRGNNNVAVAEVTTPRVAPYPDEEEVYVRPVRAKGTPWLAPLNLFLAIILVGAIGGLYWVIMSGNKPDAVIILPSLVGKTLTEAQDIAKDKHFELALVARDFRESEPKDVIYQQGITAGRSIKPGKQVPIWVSDGPRMVIVPGVRDMGYDLARKTLERAGLGLGSVKADYDPIAPKGNVINQTPPAGENRPRGTKVELVISKGEEPPPTPEPAPTYSPTTESTPSPDAAPTDAPSPASPATPPTHYYKIVYPQAPIPAGDEPHRVRIDVLDDDGPRTIKDTTVNAGEQVRLDKVKVVGDKITIKVYDNDELKVEINK